MLKIYLSSCNGESGGSVDGWRAIVSGSSEPTEIVSSPEVADLIIVHDISEEDHFKNLRSNPVWRRFPAKSFGVSESDNCPRFLHGLYSGAQSRWNTARRFSGLAYRWHQESFPNPVPPLDTIRNSPKEFLFAYMGRSSHQVRRRLLETWRGSEACWVEDSSSTYHHFGGGGATKRDRQEHYWSVMSKAKFALCPAGAAPSSVRIFEAMEAGIAPVVIADQWVAPHGPDWDSFCLRVPESLMSDLKSLIGMIEPEFEQRGQMAREAWEQWFAPERYWDFLVASMRHIQQTQRIPEQFYTAAMPLFLCREWVSESVFRLLVMMKAAFKMGRTSSP